MWTDYSVVDERQAQLGSLACPEEYLSEALLGFRRLAGHLGYAQVIWTAALDDGIERAMAVAGFRRDRNVREYLFEKRMKEIQTGE